MTIIKIIVIAIVWLIGFGIIDGNTEGLFERNILTGFLGWIFNIIIPLGLIGYWFL